MLAVIISSTLITMLTTAYQLYGIYNRDINAIDSRLNEIETVHVESISNVLWNSDYKELSIRVESMIDLPDMLYVEVREQGKARMKAGEFHNSQTIQRNFKLNYFYRGENRVIGEMIVQFDLKSVYNRLWDQFVDIIISNSIKTFLISFIILWIFSQLVTRHIKDMSDYATSLTTNKLDQKFKFKHKEMKENHIDELDVLAEAFNEMQRNISESIKEAEKSREVLRAREQFYGSILDMSAAIIYVKDMNGRFIYINRECENIFRITKADAGDKTAHDIFDAETAGQQLKNDKAVLNSRVPIKFEESIMHDNEEHALLSIKFPLHDEKNEVYAIGCVSSDISKLKHTQNLLQKKTIEQEEILNNLIDGVITINEDFTIGGVNQSAEQILGYREREITGRDITLLMQEEDKPKFLMLKSSLVKILSERIIGTSREFFAKRKNNEIFPLQLSLNQLPDDINGKKRFIASFIDLTEIKEKETLLRQSLKLEALGKLTGGIAHDYNNMLGVVLGYSELISLNYSNDGKLNDYIHQITHACERGTKLTKKLLSFSSFRGADCRYMKFEDLLSELRDMMQKTLTVRIRLNIEVNENTWPVYVDQSELEDCILNMCINAMHAMPDGGNLSIDVNNINITQMEAGIFELDAGDYVRLSIIDDGFGMTEEVCSKIFDPFFTTKGSKGSGLGLSQVYGFMKQCGGTIQVKSSIGAGTRFVMYFPRYTGVETAINDNDFDQNTDDFDGNEKILVVEDEDALRLLTVNLFESHGYQVFSAGNGLEAMPLLDKHTFSIVISDLLMPEMDGYKLSEYIRNHFPETKIQLLSGYHDENLDSQLAEDLKSNLIHKPVSNASVLKAVRNLLDTD